MAADRANPLGPADLERLGAAAYLAGRDADSEQGWTRAHLASKRVQDWGRAARCAFWLGVTLINRMQFATGRGWLARAARVLDEPGHDCVERGYLLIPVALQQAQAGEHASSIASWATAGRIGAAYHDVDLVTMARQGEGRRRGRTP